MTKKFLLGVAAGALMAGSASAADLSAGPAPLVAVPVFTWSGLYVGANVGYVGSNRTTTAGSQSYVNTSVGGAASLVASSAVASSNRGSDLSAILGGGQIGYNWQFGSIVAGLETDLQASSRSSETTPINVPVTGYPNNPVLGSATSSQRFNYIGTVRGRLGYTVFDNLLVYVTGGLAYGEKQTTQSLNLAFAGAGSNVVPYGTAFSRSKTETGYTVGGGLEYMLDANWSVKGEALYYDLGKTRSSTDYKMFLISPAQQFGAVNVAGSTDNKGVIARFGVNYKFSSW
ncbi:outer membrane beta-barrel protein [Enterovirga sp.]|uniref:outer membrane protein n=1 Tax=Enterovirga sp. TaxID=2026350 RepID=UPI002BDC4474|nr:outer membrane beta-barrel protein [Enterovirga sp.]HMO29730.1 outer membrane beta-barrel protein [Enterovirga sp.]